MSDKPPALPGSAGALAGGGDPPSGSESNPGSAGQLAGGDKPAPPPPSPIDPDFTYLFGHRPYGPATFEHRRALMVWERNRSRFGKIEKDLSDALVLRPYTPAPEADGETSTTVLGEPLSLGEFFASQGMGMPVVWSDTRGTHSVAFPDADYARPTHIDYPLADTQVGGIVRQYWIDSVRDGFYVSQLEKEINFPSQFLVLNQLNKGA